MNLKELLKGTVFYAPSQCACHLLNHAYNLMLESYHYFNAAFSTRRGVTDVKREQELIVSLTTIPERIGRVHLCLDSLLRQSLKPDRIILWLSQSNQIGKPKISVEHLPASFKRLVKRGLEIRWCEDLYSFKKIIPTLQTFPDAVIVTADDDIYYPGNWLRELYEAYLREPQYVHCHRAHLIKYDSSGVPLPYKKWDLLAPGYQGPCLNLFPTGSGGVLYAPDHLHPEVLNKKAFLELCPKADDIWLKAMSLLNKVQCKKVTGASLQIREIRIPGNQTLYSENVVLNGNDTQIQAVQERYNVF